MTKTNKVYVVKFPGGPEMLQIQERDIPKPGPNEVLIKHSYIGLNYIDIEYRKGLIKGFTQDFIPGIEAVGTVVSVGSQVKEFEQGNRVAYCMSLKGAYAEYNVVKNEYLVPIPEYISDISAASFLSKGMTAHFLLRRTFFIKPAQKTLIHAAAGGVGHLMVILAKQYGAEVIATVSSKEKIEFVKRLKADHIIDYTDTREFSKKVLHMTKDNGVNVVYDSVGAATFDESIKSLAPFGLMVSFGRSSGAVPKIDISKLSSKSLFLTSPKLNHYKQNRVELLMSAMEVFALIEKGIFPKEPQKIYNFVDIPQAHRDLEGRKTVGCSVIKI